MQTGATPQVTIDGRPLAGPHAARLITDLSTVTGVYRFSVHCNRDGTITLRMFEGVFHPDTGGTISGRARDHKRAQA